MSAAKRARAALRDVLRAIGLQLRTEARRERECLVGAEFVRAGCDDELWRVKLDTGDTVLLRTPSARRELMRRDQLLSDPRWVRIDIHGTTNTEEA
jgi:hypothetical protein